MWQFIVWNEKYIWLQFVACTKVETKTDVESCYHDIDPQL